MSSSEWIPAARALLEALANHNNASLEGLLSDQVEVAVSVASDGRDGFPLILEDELVLGWCTQGEMAREHGVSTRTVQRWQELGLPAFGRGRGKAYPIPHAAAWVREYESRQRRGISVPSLSLAIALAADECRHLIALHGAVALGLR